jgi:hypothetical protein
VTDLRDFALSEDDRSPFAVALLGAGLLIAVCIIHIQDQGGLLGDQDPGWLKWAYYLLEITALVAAFLVARKKTAGWILGMGVAAGAFGGYILSRSVGLPGDHGDIGNWGYTLGRVSMVVEGSFVVMGSFVLRQLYLRDAVAEEPEVSVLALEATEI